MSQAAERITEPAIAVDPIDAAIAALQTALDVLQACEERENTPRRKAALWAASLGALRLHQDLIAERRRG